MKRIVMITIIGMAAVIISACGTTETKPINNNINKPAVTNATVVKPEVKQSPYDNTEFNNVMKVLRDSLDAEKNNNDSQTKLNTAKAYILLIKFIKTDKEKVKKSGMTDSDIKFLSDDAKAKANTRLADVISSQTAPATVKAEARQRQAELANL